MANIRKAISAEDKCYNVTPHQKIVWANWQNGVIDFDKLEERVIKRLESIAEYYTLQCDASLIPDLSDLFSCIGKMTPNLHEMTVQIMAIDPLKRHASVAMQLSARDVLTGFDDLNIIHQMHLLISTWRCLCKLDNKQWPSGLNLTIAGAIAIATELGLETKRD